MDRVVKPPSACPVCGQLDSLQTLWTYKAWWFVCHACHSWTRQTRPRYPLEAIAPAIPVRALRELLGHKPQGADFYRYYVEVLRDFQESGNRGKWAREFDALGGLLQASGVFWKRGDRWLDVSGEPGILAVDAREAGVQVVVTAFADEVACAIRDRLQLEAVNYDFNAHSLRSVVGSEASFQGILARYCIGYCQNLPALASEFQAILAPGGFLYLSYSPASPGVALRWMFDDYAYLRQFTRDFVVQTMLAHGFRLAGEHDQGSDDWDEGLTGKRTVQKALSLPYRYQAGMGRLPRYALRQHNLALVFTK